MTGADLGPVADGRVDEVERAGFRPERLDAVAGPLGHAPAQVRCAADQHEVPRRGPAPGGKRRLAIAYPSLGLAPGVVGRRIGSGPEIGAGQRRAWLSRTRYPGIAGSPAA